MTVPKRNVLVAGATGYLGQYLVRAYARAGYSVRALVRNPGKLSDVAAILDDVFVGEATNPASIEGCCEGIDLIVSALGVTRQKDGLTYEQVDYGANYTLLQEAMKSGVDRFAYVHVLNAEEMPNVAMAHAKARFAAELQTSPIASTLICPSGFFSDLMEILHMAQAGRVYLFGDGETRITPIDGADLADVCVRATEHGLDRVEAGGPETFTQNNIAKLAFDALGQTPKISHVPIALGRVAVNLAKVFGFTATAGPIEFFLRASELDMSAPHHGDKRLADAFRHNLAERQARGGVEAVNIS